MVNLLKIEGDAELVAQRYRATDARFGSGQASGWLNGSGEQDRIQTALLVQLVIIKPSCDICARLAIWK